MKLNKIIKYWDDEQTLRKFVVNLFCKANNLELKGRILESYKLTPEDARLIVEIQESDTDCSIEDIIEVFGYATTRKEKKVEGVVYTPENIRKFIVREVLDSVSKDLSECLCADVSCGCGAFLYTLLEELHVRTGLPCRRILRNLYGIDISVKQMHRTCIILALASLVHGECVDYYDLNIEQDNSLMANTLYYQMPQENNGFDIIVGNPPYSTSKNLNDVGKCSISRWLTGQGGKADLYIPFFEAGMTYLAPKGILGYITVNSFFKSVNARALRKFFVENAFDMSIIDLGNQKVFPGVLSYNCITLIRKEKSNCVNYSKIPIKTINTDGKIVYNKIPYTFLGNLQGWNLGGAEVFENIKKIENVGCRLGEAFKIRSGIATCANNIYILKPSFVDDTYYYVCSKKNGYAVYKIEKSICRNIIKPKNVSLTGENIEIAIYPYDKYGCIIGENIMQRLYPETYRYLSSFRKILEKRNRGLRKLASWYEYGRSQNLQPKGKALLLPMMCKSLVSNITSENDLLIYNGNGIYGDEKELLVLKKILESKVFEYYIRNTSKPYSAGYYSLAKSYIENFGICPLTGQEKDALLKMNKLKVDNFLISKYNIKI